MFWLGGNGPWGQTAREILYRFHEMGVDPHLAHQIAYGVARQRLFAWERIVGYTQAYLAALLLNGREMEFIDRFGLPPWMSGGDP